MIASRTTYMTLEDAVLEFAQQATAPFSTEDAFPAILGKLSDPPSDPWLAIDVVLKDCDWLFHDEVTGVHTPRHVFFAGAQLLLVPRAEEISEGILIPGHRFIPFHARDVFPATCQLTFEDGSVIPTKPIQKKADDLLIYFSFFGPRGFSEYLLADEGGDNGSIIRLDTDPTQPLTVTVFDMAAIYARHGVEHGDAFLCTVTDWTRGHYTIAHIPAAKRCPQKLVTKWIFDLEEAIYNTGDYLTARDDICSQLALALFMGPPSLRTAPPLHFGGFIAQSGRFSIKAAPFGAILRAPDDDIGNRFDDDAIGMIDQPVATGRCDSLDAIMAETGLTTTVDELEAYMRDELSRGRASLDAVMDRVLAGRYGLEFYDDHQAEAFQQHLDALWERVQSDFDPKFDKRIAPLRTRILDILDRHVAWLRDCDRMEIPPAALPQEDSVELATISGILSHVLEILHRDQTPSSKDIRDMGETIQVIEAHSDEVLASLRAITHKPSPPDLQLSRPDTPAPATQVYQLRVALKNIRPPIWRRLQVMGTTTLAELHDIIQTAMGWHNDHLHGFEIDSIHYGPDDSDTLFALDGPDYDTDVPMQSVTRGEGTKFTYTYDFGDDWEHTIQIEKILPAEEGATYPRCIKGKRACPPEDCGGPWGYGHLLEILADPDHPDHKQMAEWIGPGFDPEALDLKAINAHLP